MFSFVTAQPSLHVCVPLTQCDLQIHMYRIYMESVGTCSCKGDLWCRLEPFVFCPTKPPRRGQTAGRVWGWNYRLGANALSVAIKRAVYESRVNGLTRLLGRGCRETLCPCFYGYPGQGHKVSEHLCSKVWEAV